MRETELTGTQSRDPAETAKSVEAVAKGDEGDPGSRADHRVDVGPLVRLDVEDLGRVEDLLAVEAADDVDLVVQGGCARVRSLPVHRRYHLPLVPLRLVSLAGTHPHAAIISAERVNLAA